MFRLEELLAAKREEVRLLKRAPSSSVKSAAEIVRSGEPARDLKAALAASGLSVIAEMKRKSPSAGELRPDLDPAVAAAVYAKAGARAVSVLTDRVYFGGTIRDIHTARSACGLPVLRKEFIIDEIQIQQSREAGADAVLLIARILSPERLAELHRTAASAGLACLVEIRDRKELDAALRAGASIIGVNNRDLDTLETDLSVSLDLAPSLPDSVTKVAESGIRSADDARRLRDRGYDAILVGEAVIRTPGLLAELTKI
ncbi:MAG: indole-3-glycerol phosphate synthase TrpC [bacterium]|nr:indole-3-glycerol phosphate synthase TrpC [bacterium]